MPSPWLQKQSNPASMVRSKVMSIMRLEMMLIMPLWVLCITQPGRIESHSEWSCRMISLEDAE